MSNRGDITLLLHRLADGDGSAEKDLITLVYADLRRIAAGHLRKERAGHSLQATALVHEAYLRLAEVNPVTWRDRLHFYSVASRAMRRVLIDHARRRNAGKRGDGALLVSLDHAFELTPKTYKVLEQLNDALERLEQLDPRQAKIVEMRFFGGLNEDEIGEFLNLSPRTIRREWTVARAWLYGEIKR